MPAPREDRRAYAPAQRSSIRTVLEGVGVVVISSLLGWTAYNTHQGAVELRGMSERLSGIMEGYTKDVGRLDAELERESDRLEARLEELRRRLRVLEGQGRRPQE